MVAKFNTIAPMVEFLNSIPKDKIISIFFAYPELDTPGAYAVSQKVPKITHLQMAAITEFGTFFGDQKVNRKTFESDVQLIESLNPIKVDLIKIKDNYLSIN